MTAYSRRGYRYIGMIAALMVLPSALIACRPSVQASPTQTPAASQDPHIQIDWPFGHDDGHWTIVNGYHGALDHAPGGSPNDYAQFGLDFAKCATVYIDQASKTCRLTNGWAPTDGAAVYAPVSGTIAWADEACHGLSIKMDEPSAFRVALFHIDPPQGTTWTSLAGGATPKHYTRGDLMGTVSSGGCMGSGSHIHMALYSCIECGGDLPNERVAHPFSGQWSIGGCPLDESDVTRGILVPCTDSVPTSPGQASPTQPSVEPVWAFLNNTELGLARGAKVVQHVSGVFEGVGDGWNPPDSFHFTDDGAFVFAVASGFGTSNPPTLVAINVRTLSVRRIRCNCLQVMPAGGSSVLYLPGLGGGDGPPKRIDLASTKPAQPAPVKQATGLALTPVSEPHFPRRPAAAPVTAYGGPRVAYDRAWELLAAGQENRSGVVILNPATGQRKTFDTTALTGSGACVTSVIDLWWGPDGWLYATLGACTSSGGAQLWRLRNTRWELVDGHSSPEIRYLPYGGLVRGPKTSGGCGISVQQRAGKPPVTATSKCPSWGIEVPPPTTLDTAFVPPR